MPDFRSNADQVDTSTPKLPVYCAMPGCRDAYWRDGIYVKARGEIPVKRADGTTVMVCGRCYYAWGDRMGFTVMAQLRSDPDSVVSQVETQTREAEERRCNDR